MSVLQQDFIVGLDPTGRTSISGAQLAQLVSGAIPETDKGLNMITTDAAGVPDVPNASVTTKWQTYTWLRVTATAVVPYVWNPAAASDPTLLKWQTIAASSIGVGTIVNSMIADNTITDIKIANLSYSKLIGAPSSLPPSGAAGGDLSGTYPNPVVANGAITGAKMAAATITHNNIAPQAIQPITDVLPSGVGFSKLRTNAGATAVEWATGNVLQMLYAALTTVKNTTGNLADATSTPNANSTGVTDTTLNLAVTPLSASSTLFITVKVPISINSNNAVFVGLYTANSGAVAPIAGVGVFPTSGGQSVATFTLSVASASTTLRTYYILFGAVTAGSGRINNTDGTNVSFGMSRATIEVTEYL